MQVKRFKDFINLNEAVDMGDIEAGGQGKFTTAGMKWKVITGHLIAYEEGISKDGSYICSDVTYASPDSTDLAGSLYGGFFSGPEIKKADNRSFTVKTESLGDPSGSKIAICKDGEGEIGCYTFVGKFTIEPAKDTSTIQIVPTKEEESLLSTRKTDDQTKAVDSMGNEEIPTMASGSGKEWYVIPLTGKQPNRGYVEYGSDSDNFNHLKFLFASGDEGNLKETKIEVGLEEPTYDEFDDKNSNIENEDQSKFYYKIHTKGSEPDVTATKGPTVVAAKELASLKEYFPDTPFNDIIEGIEGNDDNRGRGPFGVLVADLSNENYFKMLTDKNGIGNIKGVEELAEVLNTIRGNIRVSVLKDSDGENKENASTNQELLWGQPRRVKLFESFIHSKFN